jgi:hypothetical protein
MDSKAPLSTNDHAADPVFSINARHELVAWSTDCEPLLGFDAQAVLDKHGYQVLGGTEPFANRFCDAHCAVLNMVRHGEPSNDFELNLCTATGSTVRANISIFVVGRTSSQFALLRLLNPMERVNQRFDTET